MTTGCLCDSSWEVGLLNGTRQEAEWFGIDCSLRKCFPVHLTLFMIYTCMQSLITLLLLLLSLVWYVMSGHCPSSEDLNTNITETNCTAVNGGAQGNLCHVDCSNRGICDYATGLCNCFPSYYGSSCDRTGTPEAAVFTNATEFRLHFKG